MRWSSSACGIPVSWRSRTSGPSSWKTLKPASSFTWIPTTGDSARHSRSWLPGGWSNWKVPSSARAWMCCTFRRVMTWSGRSCASPRCESSTTAENGACMTFEWPSMLLAMFAIPLLAAIYVLSSRRYRDMAARLNGFGLVQTGAGGRAGIRRHVPAFLFLIALASMNLALARPQAVVTLPSVEGTVIMVFDVSGSMLAEDIKPNRLEAAKAAAIGFVEQQPTTVQIGIVAFSDGGLLVLSPTNDKEVILDSIRRLSPQRASSVGSGLETAIELVHTSNGNRPDSQDATGPSADPAGVIVLFS